MLLKKFFILGGEPSVVHERLVTVKPRGLMHKPRIISPGCASERVKAIGG
jgi:hypothetical protein